MNKPGGAALCAWCPSAAHIRQGRILLCAKHYRYSSMCARARRDGKPVPTRADFDKWGMVCIGCERTMNWLRVHGASTQASLQHDRDGAMRLLCVACNTRHAQHPDDSFYALPGNHKRCPDCGLVLPAAKFSADKSRPCGLKSYCKTCSAKRHKTWRNRNANAMAV